MKLERIKELTRKPIITKSDVKKEIQTSDEYAYQVLQRLAKKDIIKKVIKGKYTAKENPLIVASNLYTPCYVSFLAASNFYGYTEQMPTTVTTITTVNKTIDFNRYRLKFIRHKDNLFGYEKIETEEGQVFMAEPEKLLLDCLNYQEQAGNFSETLKIVENADLNPEKITSYLKRTGKKSLTKRTGFLLERKKGIDIRDQFELDNNYVDLEIGIKGRKTNTKWRVHHDIKG